MFDISLDSVLCLLEGRLGLDEAEAAAANFRSRIGKPLSLTRFAGQSIGVFSRGVGKEKVLCIGLRDGHG